MFTKIVLCADGSDCAVAAASAAAEIARKFKSKVTLVSVFSPPPAFMPLEGSAGVSYPYLDLQGYEALESAFHEGAQSGAARVLKDHRVDFESVRETGQPVDRITSFAVDNGADLIVLGSRGLGGFGRLLLGSVSDGVLHHAHCAVLIVR